MNRQAWVAWLIILLQAVLFWYLSEAILFAVFVVLISFPAVFWRRRWELSSTSLPLIDLVVAVFCGLKWYLAPHEMKFITGFVMYSLVHAAAQFFLLVQVARLWGRRPDRPLPIYVPVLAVLVFICLGDVDVTRRQRRMYQHASQALVGLTCLYYSLTRRQQEHVASQSHRWVRPTLSVAVLVVTVFTARAGNAWVLQRWNELEQLVMRASSARQAPGNNAYVGFTGQASLGSLQLLKSSVSNETALRVVSESEPGYLRGAVFDRFNGNGWDRHPNWQPLAVVRNPLPREVAARFMSHGETGQQPPLFMLRMFSAADHHPLTIWRESVVDQFTFLPLSARCIQLPVKQLTVDRHGVPLSDGLPSNLSLTAWLPSGGDRTARQPLIQPTEWQPHQPFELSPAETKFVTEHLLDLPEQVRTPRFVQLAADLFAGCETPEAKVRAVHKFFSRFTYQPGIDVPHGQEPLAYFLFEKRAAHCEFFASATAVLLRQGGVPCRYVTGFAGGNYNPLGHYWIIRQQEAHAWVEAYLPDSSWVVVDTTPAEGVPAADNSFQLSYLWDEINLRGQMIRAVLAAGSVAGVVTAIQIFSMTLITTIPGWLLTGGVLFLLARQIRFTRHRPHKVLLPATVVELQVLVQELDRKLVRWNLNRADHETLHQFAARIRQKANAQPILESVSEWYLQYAATRYGSHSNESLRESLRLRLHELCTELTKTGRKRLQN